MIREPFISIITIVILLIIICMIPCEEENANTSVDKVESNIDDSPVIIYNGEKTKEGK